MKKILSLLIIIASINLYDGFISKVNAQSGLIIIVNNDNPTGEMSVGQVKLYYTRKIKKRWPKTNASIKPVALKKSSSKTAFLSSVLKMSASEVDNYFKQRQFANAEAPPVQFSSDAEVINFIVNNPGAIGYVSKAGYNAASGKVKAVLTL